MILNNYWAWKYAIETNIYYTYNQQAKDSTRQTTIKGTDGQTYRMASNIAQGDYIIPNIKMSGTLTHSVSESASEINVEDYALQDEISNISVTSTSLTYNNTNNSMKYVFSCNGTNNNSDAITIRKIGLKKRMNTWNTSSGAQENWYFLFAVVDLEGPITVPAGQGYTIVVDMTEQ